MFQIIFYRDKNGKIPVLAYLEKLEGRKDKDSRIKLTNAGSGSICGMEERQICTAAPVYENHPKNTPAGN